MPFDLRLDQTHHRVGRDRGVDGVAAALEDLHAGARGQRLAGGDDAVTRRDFRSSGTTVTGGAGRLWAHRPAVSIPASAAAIAARFFMVCPFPAALKRARL